MAIAHSLYREGGIVQVNEQVCTRCGRCVRICPAENLCLEKGHVRVNADSHFGCIACGHCMMVCPNDCITVTGRGLSPADLRPSPTPGAKADADALTALMQARRSVRHFTDQEIDPALLERIVAMASTAPMGIPPWDIGCVIVRGR